MARVPSYRLHKPTGQAVVTLCGKDYYLGKHGSKESKQAYKRLIAEWESAGRSPAFGSEPAGLTMAMLVRDFIDWSRSYYPMNGKDSEAGQIEIATDWLEDYDDLPVKQFGPLRLKAVRDAMINATGKHGKPLSRGYINDMIDRIRRMFRWGVENEMVDPSVYQALKAVAGLRSGRTTAPDNPPIRPVDDAIVEATLKHCSPVLAAMIRLQQLCGMRPGEVCNLTPSMIDRSGDVWLARFAKHKTAWKGKSRVVFIGPKAQAVLLPFLLRPSDSPCFSPSESERWRQEQRRANRVTPAGYGNSPGTNKLANPDWVPGDRYDTNSYRKAIAHAIARAFPKPKNPTAAQLQVWRDQYQWSPNQLRHSAGTLIRRQFGLEGAQVMLGHSHMDVTQVYAEVDLSKGMEIARRIG